MRRIRLGAPMMILLLVLTACGGSRGGSDGEAMALQLRKDWLGMTALSCHADLTADYGDRVFECGVDVLYDRVTGGVVTVTRPELVAGVTARFRGDSVQLAYDGVSLEVGPVTGDGLSPLEAAPYFYRQVTGAYPAVCGLKDGVLTLTYREEGAPPGQGPETVLTFEAETGALLTGAVYWDGAEVLSAAVSGFQMMTSETTG